MSCAANPYILRLNTTFDTKLSSDEWKEYQKNHRTIEQNGSLKKVTDGLKTVLPSPPTPQHQNHHHERYNDLEKRLEDLGREFDASKTKNERMHIIHQIKQVQDTIKALKTESD